MERTLLLEVVLLHINIPLFFSCFDENRLVFFIIKFKHYVINATAFLLDLLI